MNNTNSFTRIRNIVLTGTLVVGVTVAGVAIGALGISPILSSGNAVEAATAVAKNVAAEVLKAVDRPEAPYVAGALLFIATAVTSVRSMRKRGKERVAVVKRAPSNHPRTPRDVQALAAAGNAPVDIAMRTRLPVDAVSMLLRIGQPV